MDTKVEYEPLRADDIAVQRRGTITAIQVPGHGLGILLITYLVAILVTGSLALGMAWALSWPTTTGLITGGIAAIVVLGVISMTGLWIRSFEILIDHKQRKVHFPRYQDAVLGTRSLTFEFSEVQRMHVDWARGHLQRAASDAPIVSLAIVLDHEDSLEAATNTAWIDLCGFNGNQARTFVSWFHEHVCPETEMSQLDPD